MAKSPIPSKRDRHLQDLRKYAPFDAELQNYLLAHSNLPGKRGNLWRIREAVAMAIQDLMAIDPAAVLAQLQEWADEADYLLQRAVVAGLAEPALMKHLDIAQAALAIHKKIIRQVEMAKNFKDADLQVLVQGLCYTLSVIITGSADEGFSYLEELVNKEHPIIKRIARENLNKNRLKVLNESRVAALKAKIMRAEQ
ncbi:hypothetical protein EH222_12075 [candidate division KSB1 bacterium]|nr:MAG: hypothetical protein EH222_12075 [candidate division KSB1 bacterium]